MYTLKIQKGIYRGKSIHAPAPVNGISHSTPALLKEALFQILESRIQDTSRYTFFDLCAGSGQIGFEALSQGYGEVHLCELDQSRFSSILKEVKKHDFHVILHRKEFIKLLPGICKKPHSIVFIDLPYSFWKDGVCSVLTEFLQLLDACCNEKESAESIDGYILIQSKEESIQIPEFLNILPVMHRSYGGNSLTLLEFHSQSQIV